MSYNYVVTASKASSVTTCLAGNFTGKDDTNLLVVKGSHVEVYMSSSDGLKSVKEMSLNGIISQAVLYKPPHEQKHLLFVVTAKYQACIIECVSEPGKSDYRFLTRAHGNVSDDISKPSENGSIAIIDPTCKVLALRLYDGLLKVVQLDNWLDQKKMVAFNIRLEELNIQDITFLYGCSVPTLCLIHEEGNNKHVKTYEIDLKEKSINNGLWKQDNVENESLMLIPVPAMYGGAIVIGQDTICYNRGEKPVAIAPGHMKNSNITCFCKLGDQGDRYLLGDMAGKLFLLLLEPEEPGSKVIKTMNLAYLGEVTIAQSLTYLDNAVVHVGSKYGNSQLIKLHHEPLEDDSYVEILDSYHNLGPIVDMIVVDIEKQGQGQLITCSGAFKEGSLRIIRNGIGIQEHASIELPNIKGLWPLRTNPSSPFDTVLVVTFVGRTGVLAIQDDSLDGITIDGIAGDMQTLAAGNVAFDQVVQVTSESIRLLRMEGGVLSEWKHPDGKDIQVVAHNDHQMVCGIKNELYLFRLEQEKITMDRMVTMTQEIACLDITPIGTATKADFIAVGLWDDNSVRILSTATLEEMDKNVMDTGMLPRSIITATFEGIPYLLVALGEGSLCYYSLDQSNGKLSDRRKVVLGTQQTVLKAFKSHEDTTNIFACSDRPTVIYSSSNKLVFSNVNLKEARYMCPLNSEFYPQSLAIGDEVTLQIGTIDEIQKLHIRTIPLNESPRRICHQEVTKSFGLITSRYDLYDQDTVKPTRECASLTPTAGTSSTPSTSAARNATMFLAGGEPQEVELNNFLVLDQHTFEVLHSHAFAIGEVALSVISTKFGSEENFFIVGTTYVNPEDPEPKQGRIIVFQWTDQQKLIQIVDKDIKGAPYALAEFNGKLLCTINSTVRLFEFTRERELTNECTHYNSVIAINLKAKGDFVLLGDIMKSITLLNYKSMEMTLDEIAKDFNPNWTSAVEIIDDDHFLAAENYHNIYICKKDSAAATDEERMHLTEVGLFHTGQYINVFRKGSLVMQNLGEQNTPVEGTILFGTTMGTIGLIAQIPKWFFRFLETVQCRLKDAVKSTGKIALEDWRSFQNDKKTVPSFGVIDGDLIESFLDLDKKRMDDITLDLKMIDENGTETHVSTTDLVKIVEDLTRIH